MNDLRRILGSGSKLLVKSPGFAASVILTLALGIGATTAIFSVFHTVLLQPLPYVAPERLVAVWETDEIQANDRNPVSSGNYLDWRDHSGVFESIGAYSWNWPLTLKGAGTPARINATRVTPGVFETLGVAPTIGRPLTSNNTQQTDELWVLISHSFWQSHFGGDRQVVGETVNLDDRQSRIAGVMPEGYAFPSPQTQVWLPVRFDEGDRQARQSHQWRVVARLGEGVTLEQAQERMRALATDIAREHPEHMENFSVNVVSLHGDLVRNAETTLWILMGVVGLTLLIACANAAGLMLARIIGQRHELAVRGSLGAGKIRLAGHVLGECFALGLIGSGLGILFAVFGIRFLVALGPAEIPRLAQADLSGTVLAFSMITTLATVLMVGLIPAIRAARTNPASALAAGSRVGGGRTLTLRRVLVVTQLALACVLMIGAGMLVHSFVRLHNVDAGFRTDGMVMASVSLPDSRYPENPEQLRFFDEAIQQIEALPGVQAVAGTPEPPLVGPGNTFSYMIEGRPGPGADPREDPIPLRAVTGDYFQTMGIPVVSGRQFNEHDRADSPQVMIVNESFARRHWPNSSAVGKRITRKGPEGPWREIVGVVGDTRHYGLDQPSAPAMYIPVEQKPWSWMSWMYFMIHAERGAEISPKAVREAIWQVDDQVAVGEIRSLDDVLSESNARRRFATYLLTGFGLVAAFLSIVGVYGVLSYTVLQRTGEFGLRMALGADRANILTQVLATGVRLAVIGLCLGLAGAVTFGHALRSQLFQVSATDPLAFLAVPALLLVAVLTAGLIPALKAGRTSPAEALRYE